MRIELRDVEARIQEPYRYVRRLKNALKCAIVSISGMIADSDIGFDFVQHGLAGSNRDQSIPKVRPVEALRVRRQFLGDRLGLNDRLVQREPTDRQTMFGGVVEVL